MPRNVRNFWITLRVDGRRTTVETGPQGRDGGFRQDIYIRENGNVERAATITGTPDSHGNLSLDVYDSMGNRTNLRLTRR